MDPDQDLVVLDHGHVHVLQLDAGYDQARSLDESDPLGLFRQQFVHTDPNLIYLDGNSLGRLPEAAIGTIEDVTRNQWGDRLIRAWNEGWWEMQLRLGDLLAPLVGAAPGEVIISDSTTVNPYKLALATVNSTPERSKIVTDDMNFPTDVYVLDGIAETTGNTLEIVRSDGVYGPLDALESAIDENTALVSLSHTAFESGYTYDIAAVTEICHRVGARVLWDTSHSVGVVPIDLGAANVDLAIGCTYKYLNGGPGSPAFLYVRTDLQDKLSNPIAGWWGHADPFWIRSRVSTRLRDPTFPLGDYADPFHLRQSKRESAKPWKLASSGSGPSQPHSRSFLSDRLICTCPTLDSRS